MIVPPIIEFVPRIVPEPLPLMVKLPDSFPVKTSFVEVAEAPERVNALTPKNWNVEVVPSVVVRPESL